ncbi:MAG: hypothetical protein CSA66_08225 [Proteobacteria bacterium]|nr:MAG: hypothetical protein CSA66_08225 [Pseudomonadota bacterium]
MNLPSVLRKGKRPPSLMLTPLLDMFTIILIFLMVSFEAEDYEFRLMDGVQPPQSTAESIFKPAVNVAISPEAVFIEEEKILPLDNGKAAADLDEARLAPALVTRFGEIYQERFAADDVTAGEATDAEVVDEAILIIQAHKGLDYRTVHLVMSSAREAGFYKYRLAVVRK